MAQWSRAPVTKSDDLSLIPEPTQQKERTSLESCLLTSTSTSSSQPHTQTDIQVGGQVGRWVGRQVLFTKQGKESLENSDCTVPSPSQWPHSHLIYQNLSKTFSLGHTKTSLLPHFYFISTCTILINVYNYNNKHTGPNRSEGKQLVLLSTLFTNWCQVCCRNSSQLDCGGHTARLWRTQRRDKESLR